MKKIMNVILFSVVVFLFVTSCADENTPQEDLDFQDKPMKENKLEEKNIAENEEPGSWVPDTKGPWDGSLYVATSSDGLTFDKGIFVINQSGVPNLLKQDDGTLILLSQYFSYEDKDMFDAIVYSVSEDNGKTWTAPHKITFEGLPAPLDDQKKPMDPTLVKTEDDSLRLYFTYHAKGAKKPALYSATAADGDITSSFVVEETPALSVDGNLLDPAVVFFDGSWHHYTWQMESDENYHSLSDDGLSFSLEENINLPMDFLGQVIAVDGGLRFYGTGKGGVVSAFSSDGYTWEIDDGTRIQGADPGIQQLGDGTYVMVYTSMNFN